MMGKLIWLMGPSGSGKDSLLAELRLREQTQLLVAHRYITRAFAAGTGALSIGAAARLFTGFAGDPAPAPGKPWP